VWARWVVVVPLAASLLGALPAAPADAGEFWRRVVDPDRQVVDDLIARARAYLDRTAPGGVSTQNASQAQALLTQALDRKPGHYVAHFLRADALSLQGRGPQAVEELTRACDVAPTPEDEATCTLRLAVEQSRGGSLTASLLTYERHLQLGGAEGQVYANSAEVLMALGRLPDAVDRYRRAVDLESRRQPGPARDAALAQALFGLAVALDRDEQPEAAREPLARAVALDPRLRQLPLPGEERATSDVFFLPPADVHYYRGLAFRALNRPQDSMQAFRQFRAAAPRSPFAGRAEAHVQALAKPALAVPDAGAPAPAPTRPEPVRRWRVVAAATTESEGPIPAPMLDAAWKGQRRLFEPCIEEAPPLSTQTVRVHIDLALDGRGVLTKVTAKTPPAWPEAATCLEDSIRRGVRFPKPTRPAPTTARLELVVSMTGKS